MDNWLNVGDGHSIYYEIEGASDGIPVVVLHGGPGAGMDQRYQRFFDLTRFKIVACDQRGAGKSTPHASTEANTTDHLIADIELLREHLSIEKWIVFGGSWGATLALVYGQAHPDRVLGFILRGVFLARAHEAQWFLDGMKRFRPESYQRTISILPPEQRHDILQPFYDRIMDIDPAVNIPAAIAWASFEGECCSLIPSSDTHSTSDRDSQNLSFDSANYDQKTKDRMLAIARIEIHYFIHQFFLKPNQILQQMACIKHLPAIIIQGRYDLVCPPETAYELHEAWPKADIHFIPAAGHSTSEVGIEQGLKQACQDIITRIEI